MNAFTSIWLPTVVSALAVFAVSSLVHTVLRFWHRNDQLRLPNEDAVASALAEVPGGDYRLPYASGPEEMKTEAFQDKAKRFPMAIVTVIRMDMMQSFRNSLIQWFVYALVISWLVGHLAVQILPANPDTQDIFHTVAIGAFLAYGVGQAQGAIWGGKPWMPVVRSMIDGLAYAAVTAGVYVWLWPK